MNSFVIRIHCPDRVGLIAHITRILFEHNLNIVENGEFVEADTRRFFMRTEVEGSAIPPDLEEKIRAVVPETGVVKVAPLETRPVVILATREAHCLGDLLIRCMHGDMKADIRAVVSNHEALGDLVRRFDLPFHCLSHENLTREEHEAGMLRLLEPYEPEYLVLAKYMRILSPGFVSRYPHRIINIHHSFLPAFIGASPYRQAHDRGVKIIGATAHFVSDSLDEGPIIAQSVNSVTHQHDVKDLSRAGRDIEKIVLARALDLVLNERVFVSRNKTVVFE